VSIVLRETTVTHDDNDPAKRQIDRKSCITGAAELIAGSLASSAVGATQPTLLPKGDPSALATIKSETSADWFESIPGERMRVGIASRDTRGSLSVLESVVAPKTATPLHYHAANEMFLIISGRLRLVCGGKGQDLTAGSSVVVPGGAHHGFVNLSSGPVRMLAIFLPGGMEELFTQLRTTSPEQWADLARRFDTVIVGPPVTG
jgi:mannose-6-phosphate isomerase-like protein (cupin superfamily)